MALCGSERKIISALEAVLHYKKKILRHIKDDDPSIVLHCIDKLYYLPIPTNDFKESAILETLALIKLTWGKQKNTTNQYESVEISMDRLIEKWLLDFNNDDKADTAVLCSLRDFKASYEVETSESDSYDMMVDLIDNEIKTEKKRNKYTNKCKRSDTISSSKSSDEMQLPKITPSIDGMSSVGEGITMTQEEGKIPVQISNRPEKGKIPVQLSYRLQKGYTKATQQKPENTYETDQDVISRREKQIQYGKNTQSYQRYIAQVQKDARYGDMPRTPNKYLTYSRRQFDGLIKHWKLRVHRWDKLANENVENSKVSTETAKQTVNDDAKTLDMEITSLKAE